MSDSALARLRKICNEEIPRNYEVKIIDVSRDAQFGREQDTAATSVMFQTLPEAVRKRIRDLSNGDKTTLGLDLFVDEDGGT